MKALLLGETDAAQPVAVRVRDLGHEARAVDWTTLEAEVAASDATLLILFAEGSDLKRLVKEVRALDAIAGTPLFVVTSCDDLHALAEMRAAGADEHLCWPREAPLLNARLRALIERVELRRTLDERTRTEAELRTREERLRTLIELASDAIFIKDRSGRYVLLNPAGVKILGRRHADDVIGKTDFEIFGEDSAKDVIAHDKLAMESRRPIYYDARRRTLEGEERHMTTAKFAYVSPEGDLLGIAGITRDTTDLKRAADQEQERTRQRLAHQAALLALAQMDGEDFVKTIEKILDTDGVTLGVTRVSFWSLRDDPPTVVSQAMRQGGSGSWANALELRARDLPRYFETLQENRVYVAVDARDASRGTELSRVYLEPNGVRSILDAPVWLHGSLVGVLCHEMVGQRRVWTTEEQDFVTRVGHMAALTLGDREREIAASEVRRSEARMRTLIEHLPDAIFVLHEGRFVFVNAAFAAYLGYAAQLDVIGARLLDVIHAEDQSAGHAIEAGARTPRTVRMMKQGGEMVSAEVAGLAMIWDGEPATVAIARDLTERNRLETQLLLADRMASVGTLAAGVAHEINNPLGYVLGNLTALLNGLTSDALAPEMRQALTDAVHGAKRVRDIVQDLQTFSRGDASRKNVPVDVLRVMDVSIRMAHSAVRHRARLERDYQPVTPVEGNESRLGQVFVNLIVNAAQAMPADRSADDNEIKVIVRQDGDRVVVEVTDNGAGMSDDVRRRVFDPFFTTKAVGDGTGLGLSICHSIVTSVGGSIDVRSELGVGTTFRMHLRTSRGVPRADSIEPPPPSTGRRERVLVIDDEPMIGVMIRRLLAAHCDVLPMTSAREALRRIGAGERFDAILCDLMMPRMSGIDFYTELTPLAPDLAKRTGFLTGGAVTTQARKFVESHRERMLEKPLELTKLRAFVRMLAQRA